MLKMTVESTCTNARGELEPQSHVVEFGDMLVWPTKDTVIDNDYGWPEYLQAFRQLMDKVGYVWLPSADRIANAIQDLIDEDIKREDIDHG